MVRSAVYRAYTEMRFEGDNKNPILPKTPLSTVLRQLGQETPLFAPKHNGGNMPAKQEVCIVTPQQKSLTIPTGDGVPTASWQIKQSDRGRFFSFSVCAT